MGKTIVFCADGTWCGTDREDPTPSNVWEVFKLLDGVLESEGEGEAERVSRDGAGTVTQVAKYLHGIGDSTNPIIRLVGGGIGAGFINRVLRGYTFLSRNYQPGDSIVLVGFSRGAYTVRALADFVLTSGLLAESAKKNKAEAYMLALAAWLEYRAKKLADRGVAEDKIEEIVDKPAIYAARLLHPRYEPVSAIEAVGVWDTVGSVGLPTPISEHIPLLDFVDTSLPDGIRHAYHAVSMDERRMEFEPTLWLAPDRDTARLPFEQVLFAGCHSDVGGGTGKPGLSNIALGWMVDKLKPLAAFADQPLPAGDPNGPMTDKALHLPWSLTARPRPFGHDKGADRTVALPLHPTVLGRADNRPAVCAACANGPVPKAVATCCVC